MKKMTQFLYVMCTALLLTTATGCSSTGYSGNSTYYDGRSSWGYDSYYRSGVNRHYSRSATRAHRVSPSRPAGGRARGGGGRRR